jgi:pimeloyl-ACP methyl ester carboxylesterase
LGEKAMTATAMESGWATVNGAKLFYRSAGSGPPLLLLHAGICDSRMWDEQIGEFARTHRVIAPDLRGFGQSKMVAGGFSHRQDIRRLMDHLGVARAVLVAVSMAGRNALDLTLEHPDRVDALVLVGSGLSGYRFDDPEMAAADEAVDAAIAAGRFEEAAEIEMKTWVAGPRRSLDEIDAGLRRRVRDMILLSYATPPDLGQPLPLEPPASGRLREVSTPTLIIVGDQDVPDVLAIADRLAAGIVGARKAVMRGAAHLPNMEQPAAFNRIVGEFLAGLPKRS